MFPVIRPFCIDDRLALIDTISAVCGECRWMATRQFELTPTWEHALARPDCSQHVLLVLQFAHQIVGWCRVFPCTCRISPLQGELGIGLLAGYHRCGWGTLLLLTAINSAARIGMSLIALTTHPNNVPARKLFAKGDFTLVQPNSYNNLRLVRNLVPINSASISPKQVRIGSV